MFHSFVIAKANDEATQREALLREVASHLAMARVEGERILPILLDPQKSCSD